MAVAKYFVADVLYCVDRNLGRLYVGLANIQMVNLNAATFGLFGIRNQFAYWGGGKVDPLIG